MNSQLGHFENMFKKRAVTKKASSENVSIQPPSTSKPSGGGWFTRSKPKLTKEQEEAEKKNKKSSCEKSADRQIAAPKKNGSAVAKPGNSRSKTASSTSSGGLKANGPMTPDEQQALNQMVGKTLTEYQWFHGLIPRTECEEMLKEDGDFLIRRTTLKNISTYCISANNEGTMKHWPLNYKKGQWVLFADSAETLNELVQLLVNEARPLGPNKCILKNAIRRPDYYILHENVIKEKRIGGGEFGDVFAGVLRQKNGEDLKVAIKVSKGQMKKEKVAEFMKEAKVMRRFCHPNIITMYGVAPQEEPIMIVLELASGSLKGYLSKESNCPIEQLVRFVEDACRGMTYLSISQVIHRDLAARNCLLGEKNEVKISDFGLSVADTKELKLDKLKNVPVKWLAPETIKKGVFSMKTDVWSFGVLTWEIFARCSSDPFPKETNGQAMAKIRDGEGPPMEPPLDSPPIVKKIMDACFNRDPEKRVDFVELLKVVCPGELPPRKAEALMEHSLY